MASISKNTQSSLSEINMVPFVDVVLVLLIIFMITAPILQSGIELNVPKTHTVKEITEQRLVVTLDKKQTVYLGNEAVNIHELGAKVHEQVKAAAGRRLPPLRRNRPLRQFRRRRRRPARLRHQQHQHRHRTHHRSPAHQINERQRKKMSVALANTDTDELTLRRFLVYSLFLHGGLALAIGFSVYYQFRGDAWGGVGGSEGNDTKVTLVSSAGIPMPRPQVFTDSQAVDPTKGLYKEEPKPPEIEQPKEELAIPEI